MRSYFTDHPASVDETYSEHLAAAASFGVHMLLGSMVCFIHALLPFLFVKTGSRIITQLHDRMVAHRRVARPAVQPATTSFSR